jgi:hypothetical protein
MFIWLKEATYRAWHPRQALKIWSYQLRSARIGGRSCSTPVNRSAPAKRGPTTRVLTAIEALRKACEMPAAQSCQARHVNLARAMEKQSSAFDDYKRAIGQIFGCPCCLRPRNAGSTLRFNHFRGHFCIEFRYGPATR